MFTPKLLKDTMLVTEFHHTGGLEIHHSMMLKYCPKAAFQLQGDDCQNTACSTRPQPQYWSAIICGQPGCNEGEPRHNLVFPKGQSCWVAKPIREKKSYHLMKDVKKAHTHGIQNLPSVAAPSAKNIASKPKPDKKAVVDQHISRFKNSK